MAPRAVHSKSATKGRTKADALDAATRVAVLHGPDAEKRRNHIAKLLAALEDMHGEVQRFTIDGKTAEPADVFDELRCFSLLGQYKLVVVNDAEGFVTNHRKLLERYAGDPVDHASLVLCSERWHKGNLDKLINKVGSIIKCDPSTASQAISWVMNQSSSAHQRSIDKDAASLLVDRLGTDLARLDQEIAKLALMGDPATPINSQMVGQLTGRSSDEDAWMIQEELLNCLSSGSGGTRQLIAKVHELISDANRPDVLVNYFVVDLMRKLQIGVALREQGASPRDIASDLKLWGARATAFHRCIGRLDVESAGRLLDRAMQGDHRTKVGLTTPFRNLETFCCELSN